MWQLCHSFRVWYGKDCIDLCQYFQLVALCLHPLQDRLDVFYCLMVLFWRGGWCTVYFLHRCGAPPFFAVVTALFCSRCDRWKKLVLFPRLEFRRLSSPLADVVVKKTRLCQKGDPFGHHHGIEDCLASCSREFSLLFQLFNQSVKGFRGVVGPHHIDCILLEVDIVNRPVAGEKML